LIEEVIVGYDWKNIQANLLFGLLYEKLGEAGLQRKHFAIAKVKRMRDLHLLPPKSSIPKNLRTTPYETKVEIIDFKAVNTKDQQLPPDHSDALYLDFVDFLLENLVFDLADQALAYVGDRSTERFLVTLSKVRTLQKRYLEGVAALDQILERDPKNQNAWVLRGHAYYLNGNLFDSEESYIRAMRIKNGLKDPVVQERLGVTYAKRKAWKDARVVFMKCCKNANTENPPSTTAWLYLGISCLRLGDYTAAEDALTQANILDHLNPKVWGWMAILALTTSHTGGRRV
jgi:tetratricopeptide (TPR) repeat protein